jgi:hypothetical protein
VNALIIMADDQNVATAAAKVVAMTMTNDKCGISGCGMITTGM